MVFKGSINRKVRQFPTHRNSTGHTPGPRGCLGYTTPCSLVCYADDAYRFRPAVKRVLDDNLTILERCKEVFDFYEVLYPIASHAEVQAKRKGLDPGYTHERFGWCHTCVGVATSSLI